MKYIVKIFTFLLIAIVLIDISIVAVTLLNKNIINIDGSVGIIDHEEIWSRIDPISAFFYRLGDLTCHQMTSRSFILGNSQMPVCIRDTMMFIGTAVGCLIVVKSATQIDDNFKRSCTIGLVMAAITIVEFLIKMDTGIDILFITGLTGLISGIGTMIVAYCAIYWVTKHFFAELMEEK